MPLPGDDLILAERTSQNETQRAQAEVKKLRTLHSAWKNGFFDDRDMDNLRSLRDLPAQARTSMIDRLQAKVAGQVEMFQVTQEHPWYQRFADEGIRSFGQGLLGMAPAAAQLLGANELANSMQSGINSILGLSEEEELNEAREAGSGTAGFLGQMGGELAGVGVAFAIPVPGARTKFMSHALSAASKFGQRAVGTGMGLGFLAGMAGYGLDASEDESHADDMLARTLKGLTNAGGVLLLGTMMSRRMFTGSATMLMGKEVAAQAVGGKGLLALRLGKALNWAPRLTTGHMLKMGGVGAAWSTSRLINEGHSNVDAIGKGMAHGLEWIGFDIAMSRIGGLTRLLDVQSAAANNGALALLSLGGMSAAAGGGIAALTALGSGGDMELAAQFGLVGAGVLGGAAMLRMGSREGAAGALAKLLAQEGKSALPGMNLIQNAAKLDDTKRRLLFQLRSVLPLKTAEKAAVDLSSLTRDEASAVANEVVDFAWRDAIWALRGPEAMQGQKLLGAGKPITRESLAEQAAYRSLFGDMAKPGEYTTQDVAYRLQMNELLRKMVAGGNRGQEVANNPELMRVYADYLRLDQFQQQLVREGKAVSADASRQIEEVFGVGGLGRTEIIKGSGKFTQTEFTAGVRQASIEGANARPSIVPATNAETPKALARIRGAQAAEAATLDPTTAVVSRTTQLLDNTVSVEARLGSNARLRAGKHAQAVKAEATNMQRLNDVLEAPNATEEAARRVLADATGNKVQRHVVAGSDEWKVKVADMFGGGEVKSNTLRGLMESVRDVMKGHLMTGLGVGLAATSLGVWSYRDADDMEGMAFQASVGGAAVLTAAGMIMGHQRPARMRYILDGMQKVLGNTAMQDREGLFVFLRNGRVLAGIGEPGTLKVGLSALDSKTSVLDVLFDVHVHPTKSETPARAMRALIKKGAAGTSPTSGKDIRNLTFDVLNQFPSPLDIAATIGIGMDIPGFILTPGLRRYTLYTVDAASRLRKFSEESAADFVRQRWQQFQDAIADQIPNNPVLTAKFIREDRGAAATAAVEKFGLRETLQRIEQHVFKPLGVQVRSRLTGAQAERALAKGLERSAAQQFYRSNERTISAFQHLLVPRSSTRIAFEQTFKTPETRENLHQMIRGWQQVP